MSAPSEEPPEIGAPPPARARGGQRHERRSRCARRRRPRRRASDLASGRANERMNYGTERVESILPPPPRRRFPHRPIPRNSLPPSLPPPRPITAAPTWIRSGSRRPTNPASRRARARARTPRWARSSTRGDGLTTTRPTTTPSPSNRRAVARDPSRS
eukprot:31450-Pelagococcus_subviridis.AAC.4